MNNHLDSRKFKGITLKPDETLVGLKEYAPPTLLRPVSTLLAMTALTAVERPRDIGSNGPANASNVMHDEGEAHESQGKYDVFFPRDAHVVAKFLANKYPALVKATVLESLKYIGIKDNYKNPTFPLSEEERGKIPHEVRDPNHPIAVDLTKRKGWGWSYHGAVDTTGKNIISIDMALDNDDRSHEFLATPFTDTEGNDRTVREGLDMNVNWLLGRMDKNHEGLVESYDKNPRHHPNQTWADSPEAFHHADGSWARHYPEKELGVASLEQQAEAFDALAAAARIYREEGNVDLADSLDARARNLQRVVLDKFWVKDESHFGGYFARGTDRDEDGNLHPLAVRSSDMGNILNSGILMPTGDPELDDELQRKTEATVRNLFSKNMLCPSGIRTISRDSYRYDDDRYHNGTSWPWVTAYIAEGLRKHGYNGLAADLKKRVLKTYVDTKMLGEYVSGSDDPDARIITQAVTVQNDSLVHEPIYTVSQPAQEMQAWTAAAVLQIKLQNDVLHGHSVLNLWATDTRKRRIEAEVLSQTT